ncbi:MAG TPA: glycosyltransferase family 2 protein [Lacunisphaera sp.]
MVPTYNYARFLPQTIESILAQSDANFELIISDDASTDDSPEIIRRYAARDARIHFTLHPGNLGMVANWNWCLQQARGEYIKYVFGDDLLTLSHTLARMADLLDQQPDTALVASARVLLDHDSRIMGIWDHLSGDVFDGPQLISRCLRTRRNLVGEPSAVMFRRKLATRGFDPAYRQIVDLEMWFHLMTQGRLCHTSGLLCGFRKHANQQTVVNGRNRVTDLELIDLLDRYQGYPEVRALLRPNSWAHRWILYRQLHYARKAIDRSSATSAVARLEARIPRIQRAIYWMWHRVKRPTENLVRKLSQWSRAALSRLSSQSIIRRVAVENFIHSLTPVENTRPDRPIEKSHGFSSVESDGPSSLQPVFGAFKQKLPRQIAAALMIVGTLSAGGIVWDNQTRPKMPGPFFSRSVHPFPDHHFSRHEYDGPPFSLPPDFLEQPPSGHRFHHAQNGVTRVQNPL